MASAVLDHPARHERTEPAKAARDQIGRICTQLQPRRLRRLLRLDARDIATIAAPGNLIFGVGAIECFEQQIRAGGIASRGRQIEQRRVVSRALE